MKAQYPPPRLAGGQRQPLHCLCTPAGQYRRHSDRTPWRTTGSLGLRTQEIRAAAAAQPALVGRAAVAVAAAACGAQVAAGLGGSYLYDSQIVQKCYSRVLLFYIHVFI